MSSDSWTILSPIEQSIKRKIEAVGTPLRDWDVKINRGILTGCNDAFIISGAKRDVILSNCKTDHERRLTAELIRPILRGRDIKRYGYNFANQYLIASHNGYRDDSGNEVAPIKINDYPSIKAHLDEYWDIISVRTDKGVTPYNLRNCAYMDDFSKQKIVWGELSDEPKFSIDVDGSYYAANTLFLMTGDNLPYLTVYLNSLLTKYYFTKHIATTSGVGTTRWLKYTIETLPIPKPSADIILRISQLINEYSADLERTISKQLYDIFGFTSGEIEIIESFRSD
jgi:hypothetical protein